MRTLTFILFLCVPAIIFSGCTGNSGANNTKPEKIRIILDTDTNNEIDDQYAIAYMLFNGPVFDVEGITSNATRDGGDAKEHAREARRVVELCSLKGQIKVYEGATGSFDAIKDHVNQNEFDGSEAVVQAVIRAAFEEGLLVWSAGHAPSKIRLLLPVNVTDEELEAGFAMLEKALRRVGDERGLPC